MIDYGPIPTGSGHVHRARALYPHDGDSIVALIELDFGVRFQSSLRLFGVNAPELGPQATPNPDGQVALAFVIRWLAEADPHPTVTGWPLMVYSKSFDKYGGRTDAIIWRFVDSHCLNHDIVASGHAVEYLP